MTKVGANDPVIISVAWETTCSQRDWASGVRNLEKRKATHWRGLTVLGGILTLGLPSPQKGKLMVTQSLNNIHGTKSTSPPSLGPNTSPGAWLHLLYTPHRVQECGSAQPLGCPSCLFPNCPTEIRTSTMPAITVCTTCLNQADYTASYRLPSLNSYHCHGEDSYSSLEPQCSV